LFIAVTPQGLFDGFMQGKTCCHVDVEQKTVINCNADSQENEKGNAEL
jgi:hypothetical protein